MEHDQPKPVKTGVVALVGPPNAGKSTLLNRLLGQKISIVTPKPQTTRNRIVGVVNEADYQIVFIDTPGLHKSKLPLNREMVRIALESLKDVDAVVFLVDIKELLTTHQVDHPDESYSEYFAEFTSPAFLILNKVDLIDPQRVLPIIETYMQVYPFKAIVPLSALRGDGTANLVSELVEILPLGYRLFPEDIPTDASERFLTAEIIREKVFLQTGQEIPYSTAVVIESFEEDEIRRQVTIHASIYLERKSQKGIVIGKQGAKLKRIGSAARKDIERLVMQKVVLHLWVKVRKNWTSDERFLKELGY